MDKQKYTNLPRPLTTLDYDECVELVKRSAAGNPTIRAVYLMGAKWCPGISDIDIIIVYRDGVSPDYLPSPWSLGEKAKFIFTHRYLSLDESLARWFYFLYPPQSSNLRIIAGEPMLFIGSASSEEKKWTNAFILFAVLINKLLLFQKFKYGKLNIRSLLGELYSLVYTIETVRGITGEEIGGNFSREISALRESWFSLDVEKALDQLRALLDQGVRVISDVVLSLDRFLVSQDILPDPKLLFANEKYHIVFSSDWSHELFQKEFKESYSCTLPVINKRVESYRLVLPVSLGFFLHAYAVGTGDFSRQVRSHVKAVAGSVRVPNGAKNHIRVMNLAFTAARSTAGNFKIPFSFGFSFDRKSLATRWFRQGVSILCRRWYHWCNKK